ncbi:hypothetical protein ABT147_28770 [Streptomyces sp. NPDC001868]|uniref:hypothetical protein n=1 Tax=Streptomyces sp. NPDC001868 TaxID=3154401 RepID=UPI003324898D
MADAPDQSGPEERTYAGVWPDVLDQADHVVHSRLGEDTADGEETQGNLYRATVPLAYRETLAQRL